MSLLEKNPVLKEILAHRLSVDPAGNAVVLDSFIDAVTAEALYRHIRAQKPKLAVEVGMANGISTLAILTALAENGGEGMLVSVDPNQSTQWRNCGRAAVSRSGFQSRHRLMEEHDWSALPRLLADGSVVDFAYIDGWHTFDYALVDFWYLDKMLPKGAVVAFNDCGWLAVAKAIDFVRTHRRYRELDVGLERTYRRPEGVVPLLRAIRQGRWRQYFVQQQDRYFEKTEVWEPSWDFYRAF